jgi:hypothetical protein
MNLFWNKANDVGSEENQFLIFSLKTKNKFQIERIVFDRHYKLLLKANHFIYLSIIFNFKLFS